MKTSSAHHPAALGWMMPLIIIVLFLVPVVGHSAGINSKDNAGAAAVRTNTPKPTHTPRPSNTPKPTATLDAFVSPLLGTTPLPLAQTLSRHARLPLVLKQPTPFPSPGPYGWKGIGDTWEAEAIGLDAAPANQFWGLAHKWWYDWGHRVRDTTAQAATSPAGTLAILEAGLKDIGYAPMLYCMSDASHGSLSPLDAAGLARKYPGRVWLLFNEPDNPFQCGSAIDENNSAKKIERWVEKENWEKLGEYLGQQYVLYYDAIKAADPAAKIFFNTWQLPLPTLTGIYKPGGVRLWNAFLQEVNRQGRSLDGLALHAYPSDPTTFHAGCQWYYYLEPNCVQEALVSAYKFFQGSDGTPSQNLYAALTRNKPIWITEIGVLQNLGYTISGGNPQKLTWKLVNEKFETPLLSWLTQNTIPNKSCAYINGVAWFTTYTPDYTASNLLDHLAFQAMPSVHQLSPVGATWRDASCPTCRCPGSGCP